jgi:MFS transporter, putative metabolite:H+ symporter
MGGAISMALAGYWHDVYIGTVSLFFLFIIAQRFFGDASYAIIDIAEVWPNRLRASGMGFSYGIGKSRQDHRTAWASTDRRFVRLRQS